MTSSLPGRNTNSRKWVWGGYLVAVIAAVVVTALGADWFLAGFMFGVVSFGLFLTAWEATNGL